MYSLILENERFTHSFRGVVPDKGCYSPFFQSIKRQFPDIQSIKFYKAKVEIFSSHQISFCEKKELENFVSRYVNFAELSRQ